MKRLLLLAFGLALPLLANAEPRRPHITGLSHIALYVHDIERSRAFYKNFLGFAEPYSLTNNDGTLRLTFVKINDLQSIELFPERATNSDRLYHVAVETDDAAGMRDYLAARGVKVPGPSREGEDWQFELLHQRPGRPYR